MVNKVSETMHGIQGSSEQVSAGSNQLAVSAQDIAEGATSQAAAVEELVATVEEVTNQVMENTKSTDIVHDKAKHPRGLSLRSAAQYPSVGPSGNIPSAKTAPAVSAGRSDTILPGSSLRDLPAHPYPAPSAPHIAGPSPHPQGYHDSSDGPDGPHC